MNSTLEEKSSALFKSYFFTVPNYIDAGLVQEVPDDVYKDEDYVTASVQACYAQGKRYAVPVAVETNALFYNTEKIKEAPQSWEELLDVAKEQLL